MNSKLFKLGVLLVVLTIVLGFSALAQTTWYVNNGPTGNDGRNGLSPTIPTPDDNVTGPKKTIGGAQGAYAASNNVADIIVVANTGVAYGTGTGEPATIAITAKRTFQSTGGTVEMSSLFQVNNGNAAPNNTVVFNSGAFLLSGGLTLTVGVLDNSAGLLTVSGTITRSIAAATVTGQLAYTAPVNFSYGALMTTADEFPASGTINNLTTTAGALTIKSGATITMTGVFTTAAALDLGANTFTITNTGAPTHGFGAAVTNGTLAFSMGGGNVTVNGAFALPTVTATTSTSTPWTLAIAQPTSITGTLTVSSLASVTTSAALITIGTAAFTGNAVTLSGTGTVTLSGTPTTVNGNVLLNSATTAAAGSQIIFAGATTVNGSVTNSASLTVTNAATWNAAVSGRITFPDLAHTITGNVVNSTSIGGAYGTTLDVDGFGLITFANAATNVTINGAMTNSSSTSLAGSTQPADFSGNGLITFGNNIASGVVRIDGGITNSSSFGGITGSNNINNGRIVLGGAARTAGSTIGTGGNRVGAITNSSVGRANGDGNGDIVIGAGDNTAGGFFGTSVSASGSAAGGYIIFGQENFNITGSMTLSRNVSGTPSVIQVGTVGLAGATVTVGGGVSNQSNSTVAFNSTTTGGVGVTGSVSSTVASGTISFPNMAATAVTLGGLTVSAGTVSIPATHDGNITINGAVSISGGTVSLLANGGDVIVITGSASFTGGTITTTGRTSVTLNSASIALGGASTNPTFATAATGLIIGNPSPTGLTTVTIGGANPTVAGALTVNNTTGLVEAVRFTGGTLNIAGALTFTAGGVVVADQANLTVVGNFTNTAGYSATAQGRITIGGGGGQTFGGAGSFGTIEFNNAAGPASASTVTLAGTIYLTVGAVANTGGAITINNATTLPTIVRNNGSFAQAPTFSSNVNVTYIGGDKSSGNELPTTGAAPTRLQNLTVATTTGAVSGQGVVTVGVATTVNGTIQVNASQALLIDAVNLTMNGAAITLNGDIANEGAGVMILNAATGTTITGTGYLPPITVAAGSSGNVIGGKAIINQLVGTNNARAGGDDFDPTTTAAQGALIFATGTNAATVTLTGVPFNGSMVGAVTTNSAGNTLNLGGNLVATGTLGHAGGTINVAAYTFEQRGATINLGATTVPAVFTGTGTLKFYQADATTNTSFTLTANAAGSTISVNVELNNTDATGAEDDLTLAGGPLTISGALTVTDGELVLGQNLTLTGSAFTIGAAGSFSGAGVVRLNAATAPLTFTYAGTPTIANLRISNDVNLAGTGTALTVSTAFTHDGGVLNFGSRNLTFQTAFTRTAGTYSATTGYMVIDANAAWTVSQGTDGFSIPNLRITSSGALNVAFTAGAAGGTVTVSNAFDLATGANLLTTNGKLAIADGATVNYTSGTLSAAPAYAGSITMVATTANNVGIPAVVWPATPSTLVTTFRVNNAAAVNATWPIGDRTVNGTLDLRVGILDLSSNNTAARALTIAGSTVRRREGGSLTLDRAPNGTNVGTITFASPPDVIYEPSVAGGGGAIGSGPELPATVNNLTITRSANVANATTTINSAVTVNGTLAIRNDLTSAAAGTISTLAAVTVGLDGGYSNATAPVITLNAAAPLSFTGASDQTLTLAGATTIPRVTINKTSATNTVTISGADLTVGTMLTLTNGLLLTGTNNLILTANPGFTRVGVTGTNVSHVIGNVQRAIAAGAGGIGRYEYPVGSTTRYRPFAIVFPSNVITATSITVNHVNTNPDGTLGLPVTDASTGKRIGSYPDFYWSVRSTISLGASQAFDVELVGQDLGRPFTTVDDLRIIRRFHGDATANPWSLQGLGTNYSNILEVSAGDSIVTVRNTNSTGGIITQGARFSIGIPTRSPAFTTAPTTASVNENQTLTLTYVADARDVSEKVTFSLVNPPTGATISPTTAQTSPGTATVTWVPTYAQAGSYTLTLSATDGEFTVTTATAVTVVNVNRAPAFTPATVAVSKKDTELVSVALSATDADGETPIYSFVSITPVTTNAPTVTGSTLTWQPTFADIGVFTIVARASDGVATGAGPVPGTADLTITATITRSRARGDVDGNGTVQAADATPVLQHVVGIITLTDAAALYAADASNNGSVSAYDAALILQAAAGLITLPASADMSLQKSVAVDAVGSLSWASPEATREEGVVKINLNIANPANVYAVQLTSKVDANLLTVDDVNVALPEGWQMQWNVVENELRVAMAGATPLPSGSVAAIMVRLKNRESRLSFSTDAMLNENSQSLGAVEIAAVPTEFALQLNYPNPFNPSTTIKYQIANDANVNLDIWNLQGQKIRTLVGKEQKSGYYSVVWDGRNDAGQTVSTGLYLYRVQAGSFVATHKMLMIK